jgi:hypothetical protein
MRLTRWKTLFALLLFPGCSDSSTPDASGPAALHRGAPAASVPPRSAASQAAEAAEHTTDPVASLRAIADKLAETKTRERVATFPSPTQWCRRQFVPSGVKHDVRKTDSPASSYEGLITWMSRGYYSAACASKAEAEQAPLPAEPERLGTSYWARFAFRENRWELIDLGRLGGGARSRRSTLTDTADPILDWWEALGGK